MHPILITNVSIFDGSGSKPFLGEVRIEGNRIRAVAKGAEALSREGAEMIDGQAMTLMPGLIESHAHIQFPSAVDRVQPDRGIPPPERHQFIAQHNAKTLLDHGFTGAFSGGAQRPAIECALRDEIAAGWVPGPRIKASSFERRNASGLRDTWSPGTEEARQFAQEMIDLGVDSMKIVIDGNGAINPKQWFEINYTDEQLAIIGKLAQEAGVFLSSHNFTAEGTKMACRHPIRAIYHCNFADEEALDLLEAKKAETFVSPTVGVMFMLIPGYHNPDATPETAEQTGGYKLMEGLQKVMPEFRKRGIRVLPGGDYGFPRNPNGTNARDLEYLVKEFSYDPAEVLKAATQFGGELMGMGDELGLIREGYLADLLIVDGDPLADIALLQDKDRLAAIMKDGKFYKPLAAGAGETHRMAAE